ncbi:MAG TPA: hypothetical protein VFL84_05280 [Gammaproteobacteria bacterium]|nr:hypothetical protein [Gammaproteobacteria bacterium]
MTRLSLATLLAAALFGPWSGCDREPVTPPAQPPAERAPEPAAVPAELPGEGILLLPATRRLG